MTAAGDSIEAHAPSLLRPIVRFLRYLAPTHIAAYIASMAKQDRRVLLSYYASSAVFSHAITPILYATGVGGVFPILARFVTMPLDVVVVFLRERRARKAADPTLTNLEVARYMLRDYRRAVDTRRQVRRELWAQRHPARR